MEIRRNPVNSKVRNTCHLGYELFRRSMWGALLLSMVKQDSLVLVVDQLEQPIKLEPRARLYS